MRYDTAAADALLLQLGTEIETAVGDIRRLVYALRPPALDELGLLGAIRARAAQHGAQVAGVQVTVEAPASLPLLPAAVEVAAYRIVQEALTNVLRHAQARRCVVRLNCDATALHIEIVDDGRGEASETKLHVGVGLVSMRERAAELGGRCMVEPNVPAGTRVRADLPFGAPYDARRVKE